MKEKYTEHEVLPDVLEEGKVVRALRGSLTQSAYASMVGVSRTAIALVEQGRRALNAEQRGRLGMNDDDIKTKNREAREYNKKQLAEALAGDPHRPFVINWDNPTPVYIDAEGKTHRIKSGRTNHLPQNVKVISCICIEPIFGYTNGRFADLVVTEIPGMVPGEDFIALKTPPDRLLELKKTSLDKRGHYRKHEIVLTLPGLKKVSVKVKAKTDFAHFLDACSSRLLFDRPPRPQVVPDPVEEVAAETTPQTRTGIDSFAQQVNPSSGPETKIPTIVVAEGVTHMVLLLPQDREDLLRAMELHDPDNQGQLPNIRVGGHCFKLASISYVGPVPESSVA